MSEMIDKGKRTEELREELKEKLCIASDHGGFLLKEQLKLQLAELDFEVVDLGCLSEDSVDYPDYAAAVAEKIIAGQAARGILICGTGIGMCIAANKFPGIRAALCHDTFSAKATREHNDSNVLCLGARVIGPGLAWDIVRIWLETEFSGGRHQRRVEKIAQLEARYSLNV